MKWGFPLKLVKEFERRLDHTKQHVFYHHTERNAKKMLGSPARRLLSCSDVPISKGVGKPLRKLARSFVLLMQAFGIFVLAT